MKYIIGNLYLNMDSSDRAKLYKDGKLLFIGNGYTAIKMFIAQSGNHPAALERFKNQLTMREERKTKTEIMPGEVKN